MLEADASRAPLLLLATSAMGEQGPLYAARRDGGLSIPFVNERHARSIVSCSSDAPKHLARSVKAFDTFRFVREDGAQLCLKGRAQTSQNTKDAHIGLGTDP